MSQREALEAMVHGLDVMLHGLRQLLAEGNPDDWVNQTASPLGRRRHCVLAKSGAFPSARKVNGMWQVRRKDIDAYIEGHPSPLTPSADEEDEVKAAAEIQAFRARPRRSRGKAA